MLYKYSNICAKKEMIKLRYLFFILLIFFINECYSQNKYSISAFGQYGYVFPTDKFLDGTYTGNPINTIQSYSIRYNIQTNGSKPWHQLHNYPFFGIGIYAANFQEKQHLGIPIAIYAFSSVPLIRKGSFTLNNDFALGLAYFPKHWSIDNLANVSIGSHLNCYVEEGLSFNFSFSKKLELSLDFTLSHFSNGATQRTNWAIYTASSRIGLRYNIYDAQDIYIFQPKPELKKGYDLIFSAFGGYYNELRELGQYEPKDERRYVRRNFYAFGLNTSLLKQISYKNSFGIGINLGYDDKADTKFEVYGSTILSTTAPFEKRLNITTFITYEYKMQDFSVLVDAGYYIYRTKSQNSTPNFFQRIGFRYKIIDNIFASVAIRASKFRLAHHIEWSLGYRLQHNQKQN